MPKFWIKTQIKIVLATIIIHNFNRRNVEMDVDFYQYEGEDIDLDHVDYSISVICDSSQNLFIISSSKMNHVWDLIRDQMTEFKRNN